VARRKLILGLTERYAPEARRVLEVGCGTGNVLKALYGSRSWTRAAGTDLYPRGLALARRELPAAVELFQADARAIPVRDAFDLVGAFDVLEHILEDDAVIGCIRSTLVDGGIFLAAVPQHPSLWSAADDVAHHVRRYGRGELEHKVATAGFEILFSTSYAVALLPLMALSRVSARSAKGRDAQMVVQREFGLPAVVNRTLTVILDAETRLTRRGLRWPIGGSRVIVAKKR
jgi:SAM-dependent methyltransferase